MNARSIFLVAALAGACALAGCASAPPVPARQVPGEAHLAGDHVAAFRVASELRALGRTDDALAEIEPYVTSHPWHVPTHLLWQDLLVASRGAKAAAEWYADAGEDPSRRLLVARLLPADDPRRDAAYAEAALADPASPWPRLALADAALRRADRLSAKATQLEDSGHSAEAVAMRAGEAAAIRSAVDDARRATELAPELADAHGVLADALLARRDRVPGADVDPALGPARRAAELDSAEPRHLVRLAGALRRSGDDAGAAAALTSAIRLAPGDGGNFAKLGRIRLELRDARGAKDALEQAVLLAPGDADAWHDLGVAQFRLGAHDDAIASFRRSLAADPDDPRTFDALALTLAAAGRREEAAAAMEEYVVHGGRDRDRARAFVADMRKPLPGDGR